MPNRFVALRYMDGFSCIGPDCEDNCCANWAIFIDQGAHAKLKKVMGPDGRFEELFQLLPPAQRTKDQFAYIPGAEGGKCPMLSGEGWCTIHAKWGESLLPTVCAVYPRRVNIVGGRAELSGSVSCPEVARRALLSDNAVELVEVDSKVFGEIRRKRTQNMSFAFESQIDEIRGTLYQLLALGDYPLASRMHFAVALAEKISPFFNRESETVDLPRLSEEIHAIDDPVTRDSLHHRFRAQPGNGPLAISLLAQALSARLMGDRVPRMLNLVDTIFTQYASTTSGMRSGGDGNWTLSPEPLWGDYRTRWERLKEAFPDRVERWFQNFAQLQVIHDWYSDSPTLLVYLQSLALRMALIRFMLAAHPLATEAVANKDEKLADRALVEVVYTLARSFEHSPAYFEALSRTIQETLGGSATTALLKI